jgi:hypothetical protein
MGSLNIRSRSAKLEGTPPGVELYIKGNAGVKVGLKTTLPHVLIDQSECWEAVGLESTFRNMDKFAARSNRKGIEQIGRIAREGLQCLRIERGGGGEDAIPRIARNKGFSPPIVLEMGEIPPPKIYAQMGRVEVRDASQPLRTDWHDTADTRRYTEGKVDITAWKVKPSIDIFVVPGDVRGAIVDTIV